MRAALGAGLLTLLTVPGGSAQAAWDGTQPIDLGDKVSADFAADPGVEKHHYGFYAPDLAKISAKAKNAKGLTTIVGLHGGYRADTDNVEVAPTAAGISNYVVPRRGLYHVNVASTQGVGTYTLTTKATYNKKLAGPATLTTSNNVTTATYKFGGLAGMKVSGSIKAATATIAITKVQGPVNEVILPTKTKNRDFPPNVTSFRNLLLLEDGEFQITISTNSPTEQIDVSLQFTPPKASPRSYSFPEMEAPRGDPDSIREKWLESGHANLGEEAFKHWTGSVPDAIPSGCAKCHSSSGLADYLDNAVMNTSPRTGTSVDCVACHSDLAAGIKSVRFPSGQTVANVGPEGRCMECHQGRESTKSVETAITNANLATPDTTSTAIGFRNVHYFAAAATLYGREAEGAYEYADPAYATSTSVDPVTGLTRRMPYDRRFAHVGAANTCLGCHDQHTLERKIDFCATCHVAEDGQPVANDEDLKEIRMAGTTEDYDGDGNVEEGTYFELEGLGTKLYTAIRDYAQNKLGKGIAYDPHAYPYFFTDANNDNVPDVNPTTNAKISYSPWSPRLLRAAYNYQYWQKDPGAFAHNAKYVVEVMYDSLADLNSAQPVPNFSLLVRNDNGHFDSSAEAYRDWDTAGLEGSTPSSCSRCHTPDGFLFVIQNGFPRQPPVNQPLSSGMTCESCHEENADFKGDPAVRYVDKVTFPWAEQPLVSNATTGSKVGPSTGDQINKVTLYNKASAPDKSFVCMTCHQGRQSKLSYDATIMAATGFPTPQGLSFSNVHYLVAGATQYSTKAGVAYTWDKQVTGVDVKGDATYGPVTDSAATAFAGTYQGPWTHSRGTALQIYVQPITGSSPRAESGEMMPANAQCTYCHLQNGLPKDQREKSHRFAPEGTTACSGCHGDTNVAGYRQNMSTDFDGNPATTTLEQEVAAFRDATLRALNTYAQQKGKIGVGYNPDVNSYFFFAAANDYTTGLPRGTASGDRYNTFDKYMLYAAHNMHISKKDPGSWAHNGRFILQVMYDSIDYLDDELWNNSAKSVSGATLVRPTTAY